MENTKNNSSAGWTLNSLVLGSFLLFFALFVTLFAGTIGFVVSMPFLMDYLTRFFRKIVVVSFSAIMFVLIALFYKRYFDFSNLDILLCFILVCILFFIKHKMKRGLPSIEK